MLTMTSHRHVKNFLLESHLVSLVPPNHSNLSHFLSIITSFAYIRIPSAAFHIPLSLYIHPFDLPFAAHSHWIKLSNVSQRLALDFLVSLHNLDTVTLL